MLSPDAVRTLTALCEESLDFDRPLDCAVFDRLGIDFESAFSLRSQLLNRRVRKTAHCVRDAMPGIWAKAWADGGDVINLARQAK